MIEMSRDRREAVIESELIGLIRALKRWPSSPTESLVNRLSEHRGGDKEEGFLSPFLEVIRNDSVTGPVTELALSSIHKFLAYGFLDGEMDVLSIQNLADALTHAKFVGVDPASDEVVLMKVLQVLRSLTLSSVGNLLTDDSVCGIIQSTVRMCVEKRLSELLRKTAQHVLTDIIRLLFSRLQSLSAKKRGVALLHPPFIKRLKIQTGDTGPSSLAHHHHKPKRSKSHKKSQFRQGPQPPPAHPPPPPKPATSLTSLNSPSEFSESDAVLHSAQSDGEVELRKNKEHPPARAASVSDGEADVIKPSDTLKDEEKEFVNPRGVTFTTGSSNIVDDNGDLIAYGVPCIAELFRFLISLINPFDSNNQHHTIEMALSFLATALETGGENIEKFDCLLYLVKDDLTKNVVLLLSNERIGIFTSSLWIAFLAFSLFRCHLKFQLELFLQRLMDIVGTENNRVTYEHREFALDLIVRLYKLPGFITQVYLNYDCDIYTSNLFEDLTKMLSKNAFPLKGLHTTNFLSLDALVAVVQSIESQCHERMLNINKKLHTPEYFQAVENQESSSLAPTSPKLDLSHERLMAIKHKKKLISTATEQFNAKPSKGILFMQEMGLLQSPLDPSEVATFLRENPHLDKEQLGDYISNRKNLNILEAFVKSFDFDHLRIDEALRLFLETFRLPGEAPLITLIMEHFADHWQSSNGNPLSSGDAAFTLAYAVIMLNVDQHNVNHTKTNDPMTLEQFCRNLRGTNGGADHEIDMLSEVYHNIRNNEIVMPAEQTGVVRENYLWKCALKRGLESEFVESPNGTFDHELFGIIWGPTVAALSYVFDKTLSASILKKALDGFQKCATIAAHYSMTDVFDNLIISLCKFTTLLSIEDIDKNSPFLVTYGSNEKALSATCLVMSLTQKHGDILREGWKNIMEVLLQLFRSGLLPKSLVKSEDYLDPRGVDLLEEEDEEEKNSKSEPGFLNSFVSFISMASEGQGKVRTPEEEKIVQKAASVISECNIEAIITESKFFLEESLEALTNVLLKGSKSLLQPSSPPNENAPNQEIPFDEKAVLFYHEILLRVAISNRDRDLRVFGSVRSHFLDLVTDIKGKSRFFLERTVTHILRLGDRFARNELYVPPALKVTSRIVSCVGHSYSIPRICAYEFYEFLRNYAANIHEECEWWTVSKILETTGAGVYWGEEWDRERSVDEGWIVLGEDKTSVDEEESLFKAIVFHDTPSFLKSCESLSFLVRDVVHITPQSFKACVSTLGTFVEALYYGLHSESGNSSQGIRPLKQKNYPGKKETSIRRIKSVPGNFSEANYDADESDIENPEGLEFRPDGDYHHVSLRLLDLMYTLHTRARSIYDAWDKKVDLWSEAWCSLLQGMSKLCCDYRPQIRTSALTTLQRSLLYTDLQSSMSSKQWESAFTSVLFPMLTRLLKLESGPSAGGRNLLEETRTRAATLLGKVFLQHLSPLTELPTFSSLWLAILEFMEKFIKSASSDLLADAIPELLKNMLLVMDTAGIFTDINGEPTGLWDLTWDTLKFLPELMPSLFNSRERKVSAELIKENELTQDKLDGNKSEKVEREEKKVETLNEEKKENELAFVEEKKEQTNILISQNLPEIPKPTLNTSDIPFRFPAPVAASDPSYSEIKSLGSIPPPPVVSLSEPPPGLLKTVNTSASMEFQPIHPAELTSPDIIPLANPKPVLPPTPGDITSYFSSGGDGDDNLITTAFTPNLISSSVVVDNDNNFPKTTQTTSEEK